MTHTKLTAPAGEGADAAGKWLERALLAAIVLAAAVAISPNVADPDLWGHVQYGRDALAEGLPATATYSYTAEGYRWINHENLAELLLAIGADTIGPIGLLAVKCLLGVGVIVLIMRNALRQGAGLAAVCVTALLVAVNLAYHWSVRPQLLSYVYLALLMVLLSWCFHGWEGQWRLRRKRPAENHPAQGPSFYCSRRMRYLWLAPVLMLFWANSHGGFVAGYCVFAAYLAFRGLEAWAALGRASFGLLRRLAMMALAAGLATLVNPYGPRLHAWLLQALTAPRPEITEWDAPYLWDPLSIPLWLILAASLLILPFSRRSRDFTHLAVLALTLWQALAHQRHIPFFAIPFGFWMPLHIESVLRRFRLSQDGDGFAPSMGRTARWAVAVGAALAYGLLAGKLYPRLRDMPVDRSIYPVAAVQYMADRQLEGKMVVTYNWAQYLIAAFGRRGADEGGVRVAFDGRFRTCYPQEVVDMHFDFILGDGPPSVRYRSPHSPPCDGARVLQWGRPDLVLIHKAQAHSVEVMNGQRDAWVLLYQDNVAQLWGRGARYDDPQSPDYIPPLHRIAAGAPQRGSVTWPALPQRGFAESLLAGPLQR